MSAGLLASPFVGVSDGRPRSPPVASPTPNNPPSFNWCCYTAYALSSARDQAPETSSVPCPSSRRPPGGAACYAVVWPRRSSLHQHHQHHHHPSSVKPGQRSSAKQQDKSAEEEEEEDERRDAEKAAFLLLLLLLLLLCQLLPSLHPQLLRPFVLSIPSQKLCIIWLRVNINKRETQHTKNKLHTLTHSHTTCTHILDHIHRIRHT